MKALILNAYNQPLEVQNVEIPKITDPNQLLIRVESSPINPSDLLYTQGFYPIEKQPPRSPGFEGSGVVVQSGDGDYAKSLVNKKVAFLSITQYGAYAQYTLVTINDVIPLDDDVSFNEGCSSFVNPMTVVCMLDHVQKKKVKTVIHSAAASALGKMMIRYFQQNGVNVINIVRREEQVQTLLKEGAKYVLDSTKEDFAPKLKELANSLEATIFFDAVGGKLTNTVLTNMPNGSTAYLYGALAGEAPHVDIHLLIFRGQTLTGFWLSEYLKHLTLDQIINATKTVQKLIKTDFRTEIIKEYSLEQGQEALIQYANNMSAGKVAIKPQI